MGNSWFYASSWLGAHLLSYVLAAVTLGAMTDLHAQPPSINHTTTRAGQHICEEAISVTEITTFHNTVCLKHFVHFGASTASDRFSTQCCCTDVGLYASADP